MKGLDVSKHQGEIDWQKVKEALIEQNGGTSGFVIIRAGYGMYANQKDPQFEANMKGAGEAGIPVGVYWYSYAVSAEEAAEEARVCLEIIAPYREQIVLPVFFDQEYEPGIKAQSKNVRTQMCQSFLEAVQKAGYRAGLYCSYDWYRNWVDQSQLTDWPVWIAQYGQKCGYTGGNLVAWQYTSEGQVAGIAGNVDCNIGYSGLFPSVKSGWQWEEPDWRYYENGVPVQEAWRKIEGYWYRFDSDGKMLTGFQKIDGQLYYLNDATRANIPKGACIITDESGAVNP